MVAQKEEAAIKRDGKGVRREVRSSSDVLWEMSIRHPGGAVRQAAG